MATYGIDIITGLPYLIASDEGTPVGEAPSATPSGYVYGTDIVTGEEYIYNVDGEVSSMLEFAGTGGTTVTQTADIITIDSIDSYNELLDLPDLTAKLDVSAALLLGETATTAYRGDRGKTAYDYSQVGHLPLTGGTLSGNLTLNAAESKIYGLNGQTYINMYNGQTGGIDIHNLNGAALSTWEGSLNLTGALSVGSFSPAYIVLGETGYIQGGSAWKDNAKIELYDGGTG